METTETERKSTAIDWAQSQQRLGKAKQDADESKPAQANEEARVAGILGKGKKGFFGKHFYLISDIWNFMRVRKKWWLLPILITLVLVGTLIVFGQASPVSPFIYALF